MKSILILHDIRSAENVGSLFRSADAIGIDHVYFSSITAGPLDRFGRPNTKVAKTALGAERSVPSTMYKDIDTLIRDLHEDGWGIVALEQSANSVDYKEFNPHDKTALIVGNEVTGLPEAVLKSVDAIIEIPMKGEKESLNVAVAGGIALYRLFDR